MLMVKLLNILGLLMNFIGALLLWKFIEPSPVEMRNNTVAIISTKTVARVTEKSLSYRRRTRYGLLLVGVGFLFQLVAAVA